MEQCDDQKVCLAIFSVVFYVGHKYWITSKFVGIIAPMKTILALLPLIISSIIAWKLSLFALNVMGLPGALIATGTSDKFQSIAGTLRFFLGVIVSAVGQSCVYLAFVAFVMNLTKTAAHGGGVLSPVLWPVCQASCRKAVRGQAGR
jgi:hypothetical protein